jgi:hypothetical protein
VFLHWPGVTQDKKRVHNAYCLKIAILSTCVSSNFTLDLYFDDVVSAQTSDLLNI